MYVCANQPAEKVSLLLKIGKISFRGRATFFKADEYQEVRTNMYL